MGELHDDRPLAEEEPNDKQDCTNDEARGAGAEAIQAEACVQGGGDNQKKGIVRDVTKELGGLRYMKTINYMSTHADSYRHLSNRSYLRLIKAAETRLSAQRKHFLPKKRLQALHTELSNGDVIGITTSMKGMDIAHMGLVVESDGVAKFLHASMSGGKVELSAGSLGEYLEDHPSHTGIAVARPLEPAR